MPTYVYECKACAKSFEVEQRITADPLTDCECGGRLRRVIQPVGISFKGSGFYVNDSTGAAAKPAAKEETASAPVPEGHAAPPAPVPTPAKTETP